MRFNRIHVLALALVASQALAQTDKPGGMQSGTHTPTEAPSAPAAAPAPAAPAAAAPGDFDAAKLFATTCGWCHLKGGRAAGKGPQLMGTDRSDAELISRIRNGKVGQMPAFGTTFNEEQLKAIVTYIRELKP